MWDGREADTVTLVLVNYERSSATLGHVLTLFILVDMAWDEAQLAFATPCILIVTLHLVDKVCHVTSVRLLLARALVIV